MEQLELLSTVGGNVQWYNHFVKLLGGFYKVKHTIWSFYS